jgi:hypothetical protein
MLVVSPVIHPGLVVSSSIEILFSITGTNSDVFFARDRDLIIINGRLGFIEMVQMKGGSVPCWQFLIISWQMGLSVRQKATGKWVEDLGT